MHSEGSRREHNLCIRCLLLGASVAEGNRVIAAATEGYILKLVTTVLGIVDEYAYFLGIKLGIHDNNRLDPAVCNVDLEVLVANEEL